MEGGGGVREGGMGGKREIERVIRTPLSTELTFDSISASHRKRETDDRPIRIKIKNKDDKPHNFQKKKNRKQKTQRKQNKEINNTKEK